MSTWFALLEKKERAPRKSLISCSHKNRRGLTNFIEFSHVVILTVAHLHLGLAIPIPLSSQIRPSIPGAQRTPAFGLWGRLFPQWGPRVEVSPSQAEKWSPKPFGPPDSAFPFGPCNYRTRFFFTETCSPDVQSPLVPFGNLWLVAVMLQDVKLVCFCFVAIITRMTLPLQNLCHEKTYYCLMASGITASIFTLKRVVIVHPHSSRAVAARMGIANKTLALSRLTDV